MKLYEFTITDNLNLHESEILERVKSLLENEAVVQGWRPGYTFDQCKKIEYLPSGELVYSFAVKGELIEGFGEGEEFENKDQSQKRTPLAAQSPNV